MKLEQRATRDESHDLEMPRQGVSFLNDMLNEAAIAEKHPTATRLNSIIHPHPERDFFNTLP